MAFDETKCQAVHGVMSVVLGNSSVYFILFPLFNDTDADYVQSVYGEYVFLQVCFVYTG